MDAIFAFYQALNVSGTPSADTVFLDIRRRADTRSQRLPLCVCELAWSPGALGVIQAGNAILIIP
jgi:hypothetical protein